MTTVGYWRRVCTRVYVYACVGARICCRVRAGLLTVSKFHEIGNYTLSPSRAQGEEFRAIRHRLEINHVIKLLCRAYAAVSTLSRFYCGLRGSQFAQLRLSDRAAHTTHLLSN